MIAPALKSTTEGVGENRGSIFHRDWLSGSGRKVRSALALIGVTPAMCMSMRAQGER
jgi:hypothetical protein